MYHFNHLFFSKIPKELKAKEAEITKKETKQELAVSLGGGVVAGGIKFLWEKFGKKLPTKQAAKSGLTLGSIFALTCLLISQTVAIIQRNQRIKAYEAAKQKL